MELSEVLSKIVSQNIRTALHYAVVTGIENDSGIYYLTVELAGSTTPINKVRYLRSYVPRIDDTVIVQINKSDVFVVDSLAQAGRSLNPVAYRTSSQNILEDTVTDVDFQDVTNDTWGMWDISDPELLTCKVPGRYQAMGQILLEDASNIDVELRIMKGTEEIGRQDIRMVNSTHDWHHQVHTPPFTMAINDTIKLQITHNSNPDLDLLVTSGGVDHTGFFPSLSLVYLGP
jgi:hypothetical protein